MTAASVARFNQWRDLMRSWGFTVLEAGNCDTQSASSRAPDPSGCFIEHHDASSRLSGNWGSLATILNGRAGIPPRLSNLQFARDGQAMIVCKNIANHGGLGGPMLGIPANDVNAHSCGAEVANDGLGEPYGAALTRSIVHGEAAWAIVNDRTADYVRGHKEWAPGRKSDPVLDMNTRRAAVAAVIATGGSSGGAATQSPTEESDMHLVQTPDKAVWKITDTDVTVEGSIYRMGALAKARRIESGEITPITAEELNDNKADAADRRARLVADVVKAVVAQVSGIHIDEKQLAATVIAGLVPQLTTALAAKSAGVSKDDVEDAVRSVLGSLDTPAA